MANHCMIRFQLQNLNFDADEMVLEAVIRDNFNMDNETTIEANAQSMPTKLGVMDFYSHVFGCPVDREKDWHW